MKLKRKFNNNIDGQEFNQYKQNLSPQTFEQKSS